MISMTFLLKLSRALPRCSLTLSSGDLLIVDRNAVIISRIDFEAGQVCVFDNYEHKKKVRRRLKKVGIPCNYEDPAAGALKVLYDTPEHTG